MRSRLTLVQGEKETIEAMLQARESSYKCALKVCHILLIIMSFPHCCAFHSLKALEGAKEKDANFQKMKSNLRVHFCILYL